MKKKKKKTKKGKKINDIAQEQETKKKERERKEEKNAFSREFEIFSASNKHERAHSHRIFNAANSSEEISREWRHLNNRVIERARSERFFEIFGRSRREKKCVSTSALKQREKARMHPLIASIRNFDGENSARFEIKTRIEKKKINNWETRRWCVENSNETLEYFRG